MESRIYFALCALFVVSYVQLLGATKAKPHGTVINETRCRCNSSNLTMMVDGQFLHKWLKFNTRHSIRHLSEAAGNLAELTYYLQVRKIA